MGEIIPQFARLRTFCYTVAMKIRTIAALAIVAVGLVGWLLLRNTDERQIRKLFDQVAEEMRKDGTEPPFTELAKARALASHVAPSLRLEGLGGRREVAVNLSELPRQIALFRRELQVFRVRFDQMTVTLPGDGTAQVFCNAFCSGLPEWVDDSGAFALTVSLEKGSGKWLVGAIHAAAFAAH